MLAAPLLLLLVLLLLLLQESKVLFPGALPLASAGVGGYQQQTVRIRMHAFSRDPYTLNHHIIYIYIYIISLYACMHHLDSHTSTVKVSVQMVPEDVGIQMNQL